MSALSGIFLWLLPLALLPVIIHLLNRLRYRTVKWAAMMFLRTADRDASRRAKIRQWIILATRCLMLAAFLLALARVQSRGRLARFFNQGSNMVVILFDRSPGMELARGGLSGRERALALLQQGLSELSAGTRVVWIDSATGESTPLPRGVDLSRLPQSRPSSVPTDLPRLVRAALQEISRTGVASAEIWIPSDRRAASWIPPGAALPDWSDWSALNSAVTLRLLDVGQIAPDAGNRTLQLTAPPSRNGGRLEISLRLLRDRADPETIPLSMETGGLTLREDVQVEGSSFVWTQTMETASEGQDIHALIQIPADSNPRDNEVAVSWRPRGALSAKVDLDDSQVARAVRAAILPRRGEREISERLSPLSPGTTLWVRQAGRSLNETELEWLRNGGVVLQLPGTEPVLAAGDPGEGLGIRSWTDSTGLLGPDRDRQPLRVDLLRVFQRVDLAVEEGMDVLAALEDDAPLLTRERVGDGSVYRLATLPLPDWSTLDAGFVWVPMLQRLFLEGVPREIRWGTQTHGDWQPASGDEWASLEDETREIRLDTGRFQFQGNVLAINRSAAHDLDAQVAMDEVREWAGPLDLRVFEDSSAPAADAGRRVEFTSLLALLGLLFLAVESFLLTLNIRRPPKTRTAWSVNT